MGWVDLGDSPARTPGDTCLLSGQVFTKSLFESISIYAEKEVTMATPHALEPGGHSNTPNSTQKNKNKQTKKKEVERLFLFVLENTIFFFQFIWLQQPLKKI